MSKTLILAPSGSGKTASLRNIDPEIAVIIQAIKKDLPFKDGKHWKPWVKDVGGSKIVLSKPATIKSFMTTAVAAGKKIIILDDFVYIMADKVMADIEQKGWTNNHALSKPIEFRGNLTAA